MTVRRGVGKIASKLASLRSIIVKKYFFCWDCRPSMANLSFRGLDISQFVRDTAASTSTSSNLCKKKAKISTLWLTDISLKLPQPYAVCWKLEYQFSCFLTGSKIFAKCLYFLFLQKRHWIKERTFRSFTILCGSFFNVPRNISQSLLFSCWPPSTWSLKQWDVQLASWSCHVIACNIILSDI